MIQDLEKKIDAKTAAELIGVCANTILVYAKEGKLAHIRVGARYLFDQKDVLSLVKIVKPHNARKQVD